MADKTLGAKTLFCTFAEAKKLAGQPAISVDGAPTVYADPISYAPGQPRDQPAIWHVPVIAVPAPRRRHGVITPR